MSEGFDIEGKKYISSKRAAEITGYTKDYVGQLCRMGKIDAKLIGRNWFVGEDSIRAHRFEGEEQTAEVQLAEEVTAQLTAPVPSPAVFTSSIYSVPALSRKIRVRGSDIGVRFYPGEVLFYDDDRPLAIDLLKKPSYSALQDDLAVDKVSEGMLVSAPIVAEEEQKIPIRYIPSYASMSRSTGHSASDMKVSKKELKESVASPFINRVLGISAAFSILVVALGVGTLVIGTQKVTELTAIAGNSTVSNSYSIDFSM